MEQKFNPEAADAAEEAGAVAVGVMDREPHWAGYIDVTVDKFGRDQLERCARDLGLKYPAIDPETGNQYREPTGDELLAWAAANDEAWEKEVIEGNLLTTAGLNRITSLIIAGGGQGYDNTHTRIGVGDDNTTAGVGNTDLTAAAGSSHRQFIVADSTYPQQSNGVITIRATFGTSVGNFHWQEWGIDNGTTNATTVTAVFLNHKVTDLGTKTSAASWVFTITITFS